MALNDLLKKAKETASNVAETAKTKMNEQMEKSAAEKAERERIRQEKQDKADAAVNQLVEQINAAASGSLFDMDSNALLAFTADYYDKLYLPAHSVSSSNLTFHPNDKKIEKQADKHLPQYTVGAETPVFMFLGKSGQRVILSTKALYFIKTLDEDTAFKACGIIEIGNISSIDYRAEGENFKFFCNGVEIYSENKAFELDVSAFKEYTRRITEKDFTITNEQIDALIKEKIGDKILQTVREYIFEDELLLYFAWGGDSLSAKDFVVCSDKQMVVLDREAFGLTKNVKQFYYEDVTSMATLQETNGLLDLALTAALSLCDLEVSVAGSKEKLQTLFTYEAEKAIKVYRECRKAIKEEAKKPQVVVQQAAPAAAADPLEQLEKLNKLKDMGVISEEEFNAKKADLLSKI